MQQADEMGLRIDRVVTATGSAGTQAGLVVGLQGCNAGMPVLGIGVRNCRRTGRRRTCTAWPRRPRSMSACAAASRAPRWRRTATTSAPATASRPRA